MIPVTQLLFRSQKIDHSDSQLENRAVSGCQIQCSHRHHTLPTCISKPLYVKQPLFLLTSGHADVVSDIAFWNMDEQLYCSLVKSSRRFVLSLSLKPCLQIANHNAFLVCFRDYLYPYFSPSLAL